MLDQHIAGQPQQVVGMVDDVGHDDARFAPPLVDPVLQHDPDQRCGDRRHDEEPRDPAVGIDRLLAVPDQADTLTDVPLVVPQANIPHQNY